MGEERMKNPKLRMRQVHLDFHTAPGIQDVGKDFDPDAFARTVGAAHIDSMTVFAKCHHGFSYHPTEVGTMHPSLRFDLLGAQIEALHGIGVRAPIYISVGWDELMADEHPEWRQVDREGRLVGKGPFDIMGWRLMDLASPYADYLLAQTKEVLERYGPVDGIFFDIVRDYPEGSYSKWRLEQMREAGIDATDSGKVAAWAQGVERRFMARTREMISQDNPEATVFFNSRLRPDREPGAGSRAELPYYTHVEIESLPSVQWGYNHYPLFASYFQTLGLPLMGMTGIFHKSWADFGGLKTEAALQYECARMLATGAACSVGDQLHPRGILDAAAYERLGAVYAQVESLEPWTRGADPVPEIGVLMAETGPRFRVTGREIDEGAMRMLLELHRPFQFLDREADFSPYEVLVAPDDLPFGRELADKVERYLEGGGALLLTHRAGLTPEGDRFALDIGAEYAGEAPHSPDYFVAGDGGLEPLRSYAQVLYDRGSRVLPNPGTDVLASVGVPYFTRSHDQYMSHQHTPYDRTSEDPAVTQRGRIVYCHSPLFGAYRCHAVPFYRKIVGTLLDRLSPHRALKAPDLPTTAEAYLLRQPAERDRTVLHLVHAVPQRRGEGVEVVEDVLPLRDVRVGVRTDRPTERVTIVPGGEVLGHETRDGVTYATVPLIFGHQTVAFE